MEIVITFVVLVVFLSAVFTPIITGFMALRLKDLLSTPKKHNVLKDYIKPKERMA